MDLEQARIFFENDIFVKEVGIKIDKAKGGEAVCSLSLETWHCNAAGAIQGGAIYTLADFTFAVAANCFDKITYTLSSNIQYIKKATSGTLYAKSVLTKQSKRICFYNTEVTDDKNELIANVQTVGYIAE